MVKGLVKKIGFFVLEDANNFFKGNFQIDLKSVPSYLKFQAENYLVKQREFVSFMNNSDYFVVKRKN